MSTTTDKSEKRKQWLGFVSLWLGGLLAVSTIGYIIKFLMNLI